MKMFSPQKSGFTLTELLVTIAVIFVLFVLLGAVPPDNHGGIRKGRLIQAVNNARQIHIATLSMANDGEANENTALGWPGDLKAHGKIQNIQDFVAILVKEDYLRPSDLKVFAAAEIQSYRPSDPNGTYTPPFEDKNSAFKVYLIRKDAPEKEVFLATKNYTYDTPLNPKAKPFGEDGFIVARKAGDVSMYKKQQIHNLELIGSLPGGGTVESAENCLNP
jgi:prepilin-type N-terminal cleavage/methylation domain-containing protein